MEAEKRHRRYSFADALVFRTSRLVSTIGRFPGGASEGRRARSPARLAPTLRAAADRLLHQLAVPRGGRARPVRAAAATRRGDRAKVRAAA